MTYDTGASANQPLSRYPIFTHNGCPNRAFKTPSGTTNPECHLPISSSISLPLAFLPHIPLFPNSILLSPSFPVSPSFSLSLSLPLSLCPLPPARSFGNSRMPLKQANNGGVMRTSTVNYLIAYCCLHCTIQLPHYVRPPTFIETLFPLSLSPFPSRCIQICILWPCTRIRC